MDENRLNDKGNKIMKFDLDQAMTALQSVCRQYKGTADEHEYLKFVLNHLYQSLKPEPSAKPFDPKDHIKPVPNVEG
jgi:hypothetical protein